MVIATAEAGTTKRASFGAGAFHIPPFSKRLKQCHKSTLLCTASLHAQKVRTPQSNSPASNWQTIFVSDTGPTRANLGLRANAVASVLLIVTATRAMPNPTHLDARFDRLKLDLESSAPCELKRHRLRACFANRNGDRRRIYRGLTTALSQAYWSEGEFTSLAFGKRAALPRTWKGADAGLRRGNPRTQ